jgi:hypothetical protein
MPKFQSAGKDKGVEGQISLSTHYFEYLFPEGACGPSSYTVLAAIQSHEHL